LNIRYRGTPSTVPAVNHHSRAGPREDFHHEIVRVRNGSEEGIVGITECTTCRAEATAADASGRALPGWPGSHRSGEISTVIRSGPPREAARRAIVEPISSLTKGDADDLDPLQSKGRGQSSRRYPRSSTGRQTVRPGFVRSGPGTCAATRHCAAPAPSVPT
jgi:hypothetical protein